MALESLSGRNGYVVGIQPMVLGTDEYAQTLKTLKDSGDALRSTRQIQQIAFGRRFETSTKIDRSSSTKVLLKLDESEAEISDFIDTMPLTFLEKGNLLADYLHNHLITFKKSRSGSRVGTSC